MIPLEVDMTVDTDEDIDLDVEAVTETGGLPRVTTDDEGKILQVKDASWQVVEPDFGGAFTTDETLRYENNVLGVNTTSSVTEDNTLPITAAGVYTQIGNINALLETI